MTGRLNQAAYKQKVTAAIDRALDHRDDAFRAKVLDMALKNQWDVDDPAFLIVLATGDMRVLMEQFPAQFEALMNRVLQEGEARWKLMNARLVTAVEAHEKVALSVGQDIERVKQVLAFELTKIQAEMSLVEGRLGHERLEMAKALKEAAAQQEGVLQKRATVLLAELGKQARTEGKVQVEVLAQQMRAAHFWEVFAYACGAMTTWGVIAWMGGWLAHAHVQRTDVWSDIRRWNGDELKACTEAMKTTCNFHTQPPQ